jgi:5-hydroxyisourate hydrolase-like protein (transthyretin family)
MKLHRKFVLYFLGPIILASLATETFASCVMINQGPPCQEFWRADAVFIGVATRVVRTPNPSELVISGMVQQTAQFSVEEAFKGVAGTVVVFESNDCPYLFNEGERYLVYAHYNSYSKRLEVRIGLTRTRPLSEAAEDLAYIRSLPSAQTGSRIFGRVLQQGFKELKIELEPLREVRVTLESKDESREVVTDNEGRFEFKSLSAGTYRMRVEVPSYLVSREQTVKVGDRGCITADLYALYKGQIAGKVLDLNGKPVGNIAVTLVSAEAKPEHILPEGKEKAPSSTHFTRNDGTFAFSQLMPGRYLLIVNRKDFQDSKSKVAHILPTLFYPGVNDIGAATVIVVEKDQKPQAYDVVLPFQQ